MPTYKHVFIVNGEIDYTCYSQGCVRFYKFKLDMQGIEYQVVRTSLI